MLFIVKYIYRTLFFFLNSDYIVNGAERKKRKKNYVKLLTRYQIPQGSSVVVDSPIQSSLLVGNSPCTFLV